MSNMDGASGRARKTLEIVFTLALIFIPHTRVSVTVCALLMFVLLLDVVLRLEWLTKIAPRIELTARVMVVAGVFAVTSAYALAVWPPSIRHTLSPREQARFSSPMQDVQNPPLRIELQCPAADERTCLYAAQFIPLFGKAGWSIANGVTRVTLKVPASGVELVKRGGTKESVEQWNAGAYTKATQTSENVRDAFVNIGVEPNGAFGPDIPDDQITIYFGPEREDEAAPTSLTETTRLMRKLQMQGSLPQL